MIEAGRFSIATYNVALLSEYHALTLHVHIVYLHPNCEQVCTLYSITSSLSYTTKEDQIKSRFLYNIPKGGFDIWL